MELYTQIRTDTATLAIFDPDCLESRLDDDCAWWANPREELREINIGNMVTISLGSDGYYDLELRDNSTETNCSGMQANLNCIGGRIFVGPGEALPGDGIEPTEKWGIFLEMPLGVYRVCVEETGDFALRVTFAQTQEPAQNHFTVPPRLFV